MLASGPTGFPPSQPTPAELLPRSVATVDVNPFHNPYDAQRSAGRVVLPELATAHADRDVGLPGMLVDGDPVVAAVRDVGRHRGGDDRSLSGPMHLSTTGR